MGIPFLTKQFLARCLQVTTCQAKHPGGLGAIARDSDEREAVVKGSKVSVRQSLYIWGIHFISLYITLYHFISLYITLYHFISLCTDMHCNIFCFIFYTIYCLQYTLVLHVCDCWWIHMDENGDPPFQLQSFKTDSVFSWKCQVLVVRALADAVEKSQASVGWVAWCDYRLDLNQGASIMRWQKRLQQGPAASKLWHGSLEGFGWFKWVSK